MNNTGEIGAVLIGRNEGDRLVRALAAVTGQVARVVYVDSGSTDSSVAAAEAAGAQVVELDLSVPFTAARARNAGLDALLAVGPLTYVQFIDGDCELQPSWLETAMALLESHPKAAVACGRRHERFPEASVYNRLCDQEWDTPIGQADACGGDSLMRVEAVEAVGGFDPTLIAGEEPELCLRLRRAGWTIHRLDTEMTLHDAAMTRFSQFAKRMVRSGWAYAEGADRYGKGPERYNVSEVRRIWLWSLIVPSTTTMLALGWLITGHGWLGILALLGIFTYPAMILKIARYRHKSFGDPWGSALAYGLFIKLGRPWQLKGMLDYRAHKACGGEAKIIEYKDVPEGRT
ncbi:MAG: glycosyltransferase [Pseudomonadota bacterium]